ncbi:MAG: hypothetical protein LBV27_04530, partial [Oscillospiraceae bacterium]|nr:hypothetical protein [Oscillospiraceae bacterium]
MKRRFELDQGWQLEAPGGGWLDIAVMPAQVHEILHSHGLIDDDFTIGIGEKIKWVAERDWTYRCSFEAGEGSARTYLYFGLLDTLVDVYLNGRHIAYSQSMYLPLRVEVTDSLEAQNLLELKFRSPYQYMAAHPLPKEWEGRVKHHKILRKCVHDFSNYLGAQPYITAMGVGWSVYMEKTDAAEITRCDVTSSLSSGYGTGAVSLKLFTADVPGLGAVATVFGPDGETVGSGALDFAKEGGDTVATGCIGVENPALWWPAGHGAQPLYKVDVALTINGETVDTCTKHIGFRELHTNMNFELTVNGRRIRLWGSNIPPVDGKTRRYNPERVETLLDLAEMAHMKTLRIWGEGEPVDDRFYEACDSRGILVWQEFFHGYDSQPDTREFFDLCLEEGAHMVNRLKHHPCIFMWCGGNETIMGSEFDSPGLPVIGAEILLKDYKALVERLDPDRYYHPTSPWGGPYANCPEVGDTHGYEMWRYNPGMEYPVAFTEHMRVSGAAVKSLKRFMPDNEFWPEDYVDSTTYSRKNDGLMPKAWAYRAGG